MIKKRLLDSNYDVYEDGTVSSIFTGKKILPFKEKGYYYVNLFINKKNIKFRLDYVVANAFLPLIDEDGEIIHLDNNRDNHHYKNLQWVSFESTTAIDALKDSSYIVFQVDINGYLNNIFRSIKHSQITVRRTKDTNKYSYYKLSSMTIVDVNTHYIVFEYKDKLSVFRYNTDMVKKLLEVLDYEKLSG